MKIILWAALAALAVSASPITFTISTSASGSLNGTAFGDNTITFTQVTDTTLVGTCFGNDLCPPESTSNSVTISGVGTFTITENTVFFDNPNTQAGFDIQNQDILTERDPVFATYNMTTALGPIFDVVVAAASGGIATTGGNLIFTGNSADATFTAVTGSTSAPEPGSVGLILIGAIALLIRRNLS
jgi:hypothetical protein